MCVTGLAALGTADEEVFEDLKNVLYMDDAVAGEAAGIGMGLLCCGSGSGSKTQEMLAYAHDTQVGGVGRSAVCLVAQGNPGGCRGCYTAVQPCDARDCYMVDRARQVAG